MRYIAKKVYEKHQCSANLQPIYSSDTWVLDWGSMPILGLTIVAVIGVLMVPSLSIFRSVPQNNTPSMTSPSLAPVQYPTVREMVT